MGFVVNVFFQSFSLSFMSLQCNVHSLSSNTRVMCTRRALRHIWTFTSQSFQHSPLRSFFFIFTAYAFIYYRHDVLRDHQFGLARSSTGIFEPPSFFLCATADLWYHARIICGLCHQNWILCAHTRLKAAMVPFKSSTCDHIKFRFESKSRIIIQTKSVSLF